MVSVTVSTAPDTVSVAPPIGSGLAPAPGVGPPLGVADGPGSAEPPPEPGSSADPPSPEPPVSFEPVVGPEGPGDGAIRGAGLADVPALVARGGPLSAPAVCTAPATPSAPTTAALFS